MSNFSESGRSFARRALDKSNFSQTCTLLSNYLKEKGSFGDLNLGMTCNLQGKGKQEMFRPTTMNLFPKLEKSGGVWEKKEDKKVNSIDFFPPRGGFKLSFTEDAQNRGDLSAKMRPAAADPRSAQMTIFYGGRVVVFDDLPADKAKEIMLLGSKSKGILSDCRNGSPLNSNFVSTSGNEDRLQRPSPQSAADASDLPIARKASLHRFLEKRKGRISAKAPYQLNVGSSSQTETKQTEESKPWLGLASKTN